MSVSLPNGAAIYIASGYGSAKTVSALTNASPAAATSTSHGLSDGTFIEVTSGWSRANGNVRGLVDWSAGARVDDRYGRLMLVLRYTNAARAVAALIAAGYAVAEDGTVTVAP